MDNQFLCLLWVSSDFLLLLESNFFLSSRFSKNLSIHLSCLICTIKLKSFFSFCGVDGDVPAFIPDFGHLYLSLSFSLGVGGADGCWQGGDGIIN